MMGGEASLGANEAKRGLSREPGKPFWTLRGKGKQTLPGTDHHVLTIAAGFDQWDDVRWLFGRRGPGSEGRTRAGSRGCGYGCGWPLGCRSRGERRSREDSWLSELLEQVAEVGHLLLESGELGLHGSHLLRQGEQCSGQRCDSARSRERSPLLRQRRERAMMQAGELAQVVLAQASFATIAGMALDRQVGLHEPATQGFGINAQMPTAVGQRQEGHEVTPFRRDV